MIEEKLNQRICLKLECSLHSRFRFDNAGYHGAVLVNYTVIAGSVGNYVDASSITHMPNQTLCLLKIPEVPEAKLNLTGVKYEILEDDTRNRGFKVCKILSTAVWLAKLVTCQSIVREARVRFPVGSTLRVLK